MSREASPHSRLRTSPLLIAMVVIPAALLHHRSTSGRRADLTRINDRIARLRVEQSTDDSAARLQALVEQQRESPIAPPDYSELVVSRLMTDIAETGGVAQSWNTGDCRIRGTIGFRTIAFTLHAPFNAVYELLLRIEAYTPLARVERLTMQRVPAGAGDHLLVTVRLSTFAPKETCHGRTSASPPR